MMENISIELRTSLLKPTLHPAEILESRLGLPTVRLAKYLELPAMESVSISVM